jgi:peptidoglycan-associated lipoprotein
MFMVVFCSSKEHAMDEPLLSLGPHGPVMKEAAREEEVPLDFKIALFNYNRAELRPEGKKALIPTAKWLKKNADAKIQVEGYCDKRGSDQYNLILGEKRAASAKKFLVSQGVDPSRISTISYGRVVDGDDTTSNLAHNRRIGIVAIFPE